MSDATHQWIGSSGNIYTYHVFEIPTSLNVPQVGNYIYARKEGSKWVPIYIGQGELNTRANYHHELFCLREKGATHFHCHTNAPEQARCEEKHDLLANHREVYKFQGCNKRPSDPKGFR